MRSVKRIRLWLIEARLHAVAPFFSFGCLAFFAVVIGAQLLSTHVKNEKAVMCLAENIYHEARGEGPSAMYIQGMLTIARVADPDPQWPKTICGAVAQEKQYSWVLDYRLATNRNEQAKWEKAQYVARDLLKNAWTTYRLPAGWECARYYKRTDGKGVSKASAKFFEKLFPVGTFGSHTAFQEKRGCKYPLPTA